jgi:hypothetical protein
MRISRKFILLAVLLVAAVIVFSLAKSGESVNPNGARRAVEAQGYTNVQYIGIDMQACGQETAGYAFEADNANGLRVRVIACNPDGLMNYSRGWHIVTR